MAEIKLQKRAVYAGDVHIALLKAGWRIADATKFVRELPNAEVEPVRHGYWKERRNLAGRKVWDCSECDTTSLEHGLYCPYCGARMDGGADNG